ncbi:unnamed protein product [Cochlearia groenlandica]
MPDRFQAHKGAIEVSLNSVKMKFDQVVGMMQAHEIQQLHKGETKGKSIAPVAENQPPSCDDLKDQVGMIVKKYFKKIERGQCKFTESGYKSESKDPDEEDQGMMNKVAYLSVVKSESESDDESATISDNQALLGTLLKLRNENRDLLEVQLKLQSDNQKLIKKKDDLVVVPLKLQEDNQKLVKEDLLAMIESLNAEVKSKDE